MDQVDHIDPSVFIELSDLSITELIILQIIIKVNKPIKRHHLYLELQNYFDHKKKISTSSFYNSLDNMAKDHLVEFIVEGKKSKSIMATDKTKRILNSLMAFVLSSSFDMTEFELNFIEEIEKKLRKPSLGSILVIDTSNYVDLQLLEYLKNRSISISMLTLDNLDISNLKQLDIYETSIRDLQIREPDNSFDTIIVPVYLRDLQTDIITKNSLNKELNRILRADGVLVTTSFTEFPTTDNYFANEMLKMYNSMVATRMMTEEELKKDFEQLNHSKKEIFDYHGMLIGIFWK